MHPSTFSIVACDLNEPAWGVAVASKFLAAGAVVPFAQAGAGAIATQSYANTSYGPNGLALLAQGASAQETLDRLVADDEGRGLRQVGIVDAQGRAATYTGADCFAWAGGRAGENYACQGNILVSQATVDALAEAFEGARGELADRLAVALAAGDKAGGDKRGRQAAGLIVVKPQGGYGGWNDRYLDLRVDDDPQPTRKLLRLVKAHHLFFGESRPEDRTPIRGKVARELQTLAKRLGYYAGRVHGDYDEATRRALREFLGNENLEERTQFDAGTIDLPALEYLRERFARTLAAPPTRRAKRR